MTERRGRGDGTLFQRADGYWVGGVELPPGPDGNRRYKRVVRKNRNDCLEALRQLKKDADAGRIVAGPTTTVSKWLDYWATEILPHRAVKPPTIYQYELAIRRYLKPHIGEKRLDRLQPADVRALYVQVSNAVSARAAQKADQVLRLAVKAAVREGVVGSNVMERVDKPTHVKKEAQAFSSDVAMHIIATAVETQGAMWGARWAFGFLTGARESEVLGMEWARVDFGRGLVDISWQLQRMQKVHGCTEPCGRVRPAYCPKATWKYPRGDYRECSGTLCWTRPKTKAGRRLIPLVPAMADILHRIEHDVPNPHGLVFHHPDGKPIDQEQDQKAWKKLLVAAKVPHVPQHTIRHSTATLLLEAGVDVHIVQSVIGHSDIATTHAYQHVNMELARSAWGNLNALVSGGGCKDSVNIL
jgi:integrase